MVTTAHAGSVSDADVPDGLRVLAIRPPPARQTIRMDRVMCSEPLELEYLYTVLTDPQRGPVHRVQLWDGLLRRGDPVRHAAVMGAQVVLLTAHITNVPTVLGYAARLKRLESPPRVFVGGVHAEVLPEHLFHPAVDGVFFADALAGVVRVLAHLARGEAYHHAPGAAFQREGRWVRNPGPHLDPARLPIPQRPLLQAHPQRYNFMDLRPCASVKTAFGCPGACTFCFCAEMHGGGYGPRPVQAVVDEIAALPVPNVFLVDDSFLTSPERVREFCRQMRRRQVHKHLVAYGTADFVARHPELLRELRQVGLEMLIVGLEFIQDSALQAVHKRARQADNQATIALCRQVGVELVALFMVDPNWRHGDLWRLARFVSRRRLAFATFTTLTVFPGTSLARSRAGAQSPTLPPAATLWRYDLLRLHQRPRHLSRMSYYLWVFLLYMLPGLQPATGRTLLRRYGLWGTLKLVAGSALTGVEFLLKLLLWR